MESFPVQQIKELIGQDRAEELKAVLETQKRLDLDQLHESLNNRTLLHRCCEKGSFNCCKLLIQGIKTPSGEVELASPNVQSFQREGPEEAETPLHIAARVRGGEACLHALLQHPKARQDRPDAHGKLPLHMAVENSAHGTGKLKLLLDHLMDIQTLKARDNRNRTAEEYAQEKGNKGAVLILRETSKHLSAEKEVVKKRQSSPYAPALSGDPDSDSKGLSQPVYRQLLWMMRDQNVVREVEITPHVFSALRQLSMTEAMATLKNYESQPYCSSDRNSMPFAEFISEHCATTKLVGTWNGLVPGKRFGYIKTETTRPVFAHATEVEDVDNMHEGQRVEFHFQKRNNKALNVKPYGSSSSTSLNVLWCTLGGTEDPNSSNFVAPRLMLATHEEAATMYSLGVETQKVPFLNQPYLEKVVSIPAPLHGLPRPELLFASCEFSVESAMKGARELNDVKSLLDEKDIQVWKEHTRKTLITSDVVGQLRRRFDVELCTKAFAKMYEMLCAFDLVELYPGENEFNSVHLCEAPGGFISATNHYLASRFQGVSWNWFACTLNPYFEGNNADAMVEDDKFINETFESWYFGQDNSGDMRLPENIQGAWERSKKMGKVMLVTADGSIDCSGCPAEQEAVVAQLHYCESVCALGLLARGGSFVLKTFTLFEHSSIGILYLLSSVFEQVSVCKPVMSTPGNSETYVIAKGFNGIDLQHLKVLLEHCGRQWPTGPDGEPRAIVPQDCIEESWLQSVVRTACIFAKIQASVIRRNLSLFDQFDRNEAQAVRKARQMVVEEWIRRFQIKGINKTQRIASRTTISGSSNRIGQQANQRKRDAGNLDQRLESQQKRQAIRDGQNSALDRLTRPESASSVSGQLSPDTISMQSTPEISRGASNEGAQGVINGGGSSSQERHGDEATTRPGLGSASLGHNANSSDSPKVDESVSVLEPRDACEADATQPPLSKGLLLMMKTGWKPGQSLGKDGQGRKDPVLASNKEFGCKKGIGSEAREELDVLKILEVDPQRVIFISKGMLGNAEMDQLITSNLATGKRVKEYQLSKHCREDIILRLLKARGTLHGLPACSKSLKQYFGCYRVPCPFLSRSALKLADLEWIISDKNGVSILRPTETVNFVDMYGGAGGFSHLMLQRQADNIQKGWIFDRIDKKSPKTPSLSPENQGDRKVSVFAGEHGDGVDMTCMDQLSAFASSLSDSCERISLVFGDGLVLRKVTTSRSIESLNIDTMLLQSWTALTLLEEGGNFICRISDTLGRCMVGLTWLLCRCFERVCIVRPSMSCPAKSERFLICLNLNGDDGTKLKICDHLLGCIRSARESRLSGSPFTLVEVVPMKLLLQRGFLDDFVKINEKDLEDETRAIDDFFAHKDKAGGPSNESLFEQSERLGVAFERN